MDVEGLRGRDEHVVLVEVAAHVDGEAVRVAFVERLLDLLLKVVRIDERFDLLLHLAHAFVGLGLEGAYELALLVELAFGVGYLLDQLALVVDELVLEYASIALLVALSESALDLGASSSLLDGHQRQRVRELALGLEQLIDRPHLSFVQLNNRRNVHFFRLVLLIGWRHAKHFCLGSRKPRQFAQTYGSHLLMHHTVGYFGHTLR